MRKLRFVLVSLIPSALAQQTGPTDRMRPADWMVRTARMEGAASDVQRQAAVVHEVAARIVASGRLQAMAELQSDVAELNRQVVSAQMAAQVLDEPIE